MGRDTAWRRKKTITLIALLKLFLSCLRCDSAGRHQNQVAGTAAQFDDREPQRAAEDPAGRVQHECFGLRYVARHERFDKCDYLATCRFAARVAAKELIRFY